MIVNNIRCNVSKNKENSENKKKRYSYKIFFKDDFLNYKNNKKNLTYSERMRKLRDLIKNNPGSMSYIVLEKYPHLI